MRRTYFDYNATTPVDPSVTAFVNDGLRHVFGNPSSIHGEGRKARRSVDEAREAVASLLKCPVSELVFCGSGSECNNLAIRGVAEADIVLSVALHLEKLLLRAGHEVMLTRAVDEFVGLPERAETANAGGACAFVSLHCNADPDPDEPGMPEGCGEEIFVYPGSAGGRRLAAALGGGVDAIFPAHGFRGVKEANYSVLKRTRMPAALIELGFIDSASELLGLSHPASYMRIAWLLAGGIDEYAHDNELEAAAL